MSENMTLDDYELYELDEPNLNDWERSLYDDVRTDEAWETVTKLSRLRSRAGTEDERRAARYIVERLQEYDVPVQSWNPTLWTTCPRDGSISAVSPVRDIDTNTDRPAIKSHAWASSESARGEVALFEVPDVPAREFRKLSIDDFHGDSDDVEGKIVVVGRQIVGSRIIKEVEERGAAGFVNVHPHEEEAHQLSATKIWGTIPTPDRADLLPQMPSLTVAAPIGDQIRDLAEAHGSVELSITAESPREWTDCAVVVGKVPAESTPTDDFVLLHGHYDSIEFGATDNATGNAGMIEVARILNEHRDRLHRDLWVAFWPNHERIYGGSTWFADEFAHELMDNCVAHVNMDSIGAKDATEFDDFPPWMPEAAELCRTAIEDVSGKDSPGNRVLRASDYSFYNIGVTGMMGLNSSIPEEIRRERGYHTVSGSGGNADAWHLTTDTLDKADPDVLTRDTRVYLVIVARLLGNEIVPLDHRESLRHGRETVEAYDERAGASFDLGPVLREFEAMNEVVDEFYTAAESGDIDSETANEVIKRISRSLVPIDHVKGNRFEQDLATQRDPFPTLRPATSLPQTSGDEFEFQKVELRRERNRAVYELKRANRALRDAVE
jgi:hypothetical protein